MAGKVNGLVKVAIIGPGGISGAHARGYIKYPQKIKVVAVCDIVPERNKQRKAQLGDDSIREYTDWKLMLKEMGERIDAVDICLPHDLHGPAILDAAAAGKHVLCEKPMCTSLAEADQIAKAVKQSGITYMSAHNQLFMPVVQEAKKMIEAGDIGRVFWLRSQDCFRAGNDTREKWGWRAILKRQGGGELIDTGYHPTYRLLFLGRSPVLAVRSTMQRYANPIDGEDSASVQVQFAGGAVGEILTSWAYNLPYGTHHIHVIGENGQIFGSDNTLYFLPKGYSEPAKRQFQPVETFEAEIEHFADCLHNGTRPMHSVEEGRAVLEVILKAAETPRDGRSTRC